MNPRNTLYVGGLSEEVDVKTLQAMFTTFGEVSDVSLPLDYQTQKHRGFAFVQMETEDDAKSAFDNMNESELFGRTIRVNISKNKSFKSGGSGAIWNDDEYLRKYDAQNLLTEDLLNKSELNEITQQKLTQSIPSTNKNIVKVFMDISIDGQHSGRLEFDLYAEICPKTVENFRRLCVQGKDRGYRKNIFHRIIPGFMAQGGDYTNQNGTGGKSVYGKHFDDENFTLKHDSAGVLSMANSGPNTNGSQFFMLFSTAEWLDNKHVVFGRLVKGFNVLKRIEMYGAENGTPKKPVVIEDCGEIK